MLVRLAAGPLKVTVGRGDKTRIHRIVLSRLDDQSERVRQFESFERRSPSLGVYLGLRRDCGSTLTQVGEPQAVSAGELRRYVFEGPINDFPSPEVEKDNVNYLAGIREIGVRSEYTDGATCLASWSVRSNSRVPTTAVGLQPHTGTSSWNRLIGRNPAEYCA